MNNNENTIKEYIITDNIMKKEGFGAKLYRFYCDTPFCKEFGFKKVKKEKLNDNT